jgi:Ca2+-binding EF-hand superfamily protein
MIFAEHVEFTALKEKSFKKWTKNEVWTVLHVFYEFDTDSSGFLDREQMGNLCDTLCIDPVFDELDKMSPEAGKIDKKTFFAWYVKQCGGSDVSQEQVDAIFADHVELKALKGKAFKQWTKNEVWTVLHVFFQFDTDSSGFLEREEMGELCDTLCIEPIFDELDKLSPDDGKIDKKTFFLWYVKHCGDSELSKEEVDALFAEHVEFQELRQKAFKQWSKSEVWAVLHVFFQYDADSSGFLDLDEIGQLCDTLCIDPVFEELDKLSPEDGKIDKKTFFAWYVKHCCDSEVSRDEVDSIFSEHVE